MYQEQYKTNKRKFKQLTYKDRIKIETLYKAQHLTIYKLEIYQESIEQQ